MDLVANPNTVSYAAYLTSQLYYRRNPVTLSMEDFIAQMDEGGVDKVVLLRALLDCRDIPVAACAHGFGNWFHIYR